MPRNIPQLQELFNLYIAQQRFGSEPRALYEPFGYVMSLGGKRTRPLLMLMAYESFGKDASDILSQAFAIELFHNFTLLHDDIMDNASLRRGSQTVHTKYGLPPAILSGDAMLVYAYKYLSENRKDDLDKLLELFNRMAIGVCEGQQWDLVFENRDNVSIEDYINMIEQKTALLLGTSLQIGAVLAGASDNDANNLYKFGINTGIAFQLLDDLLDAFGDEANVGKASGGDIVQNKKTILYLEAIHQADDAQRKRLSELYRNGNNNIEQKVKEVKEIFTATKSLERTRGLVAQYHDKAIDCLNAVNVPEANKSNLKLFSEQLMQRTF